MGGVIEEANRMRKFLMGVTFASWEGIGYIRLFAMR